MYLNRRELLTNNQRLEIMNISENITADELYKYYTLSFEDIDLINKHRLDHNRIGFAVQLTILRHSGWAISDFDVIPINIIQFVAKQLDVDFSIFEIYLTQVRKSTKSDHLNEICEIFGYRKFDNTIKEFIFNKTLEKASATNNGFYIVNEVVNILKQDKIILPSIRTIEQIVWESRKHLEKNIFENIYAYLNTIQKSLLDKILLVNELQSKTRLSWLREIPGKASPETFLEIIKRLEYIYSIEIKVNLNELHNNKEKELYRLASKYDSYDFKRFDDFKRYGLLVIYLLNLQKDFIDQAFYIHDTQITTLQSNGRKAQEELMKKNGKKINIGINHYAKLGKVLIEAKENGVDPFKEIEKVMSWTEFINSVNDASEVARPKEYDYLDLLHTQYRRLRRYTPVLIKSLNFKASNTGQPILNALETIAEVNNSNKKKISKGAPLDFVPKRWEKHVYDEDGNINRQYYELAAFTEFRNAVRSGDISIVGSRQYKDFEGYLMSKEEWEKYKLRLIQDIKIPLSVDEYLNERSKVLYEKLEWLSKNIETLEGISIDKDKFVLSKLGKGTPDEAKELSSKLYSIVPNINLTDLLIEVSNWTDFEKQFIHASTNKEPSEDDKTIIMATLMALGTNIGLNKMAQATTEKISYNQLANVSNWRMYDDAMNKAEATIVNFQHNQVFSQYWGHGITSSSDGMRVQNAVSALNASHNPHYGSERGATIYRFTSDQYSSFYSTVINTNSRDAIHVIDGLLHHETELNIEEHYTDTAGYTDQIFALTNILGFRFAPRLRDLSDSKLYSMDKTNEFSNLKEILKGKINSKIIKENYDDVLRLIYSIKEGRVSGALIMSKLGSYSRQNSLATALRELGRIEKTIFILDYVSSKSLRRRIQKGLNKGEAMNALARAIFFGKHGQFHERAIQDQLQKSSALNILINSITLWNTVYLSKAVEKLKEKESFNEELLNNISPLAWEHINFVGEYNFYSKTKYDLSNLRPLNDI